VSKAYPYASEGEEKMAKDKKSKRKKDGADEKMDKELLDEIARAENEGFSMSQYLIDNKKSIKKKDSDFKSTKQID